MEALAVLTDSSAEVLKPSLPELNGVSLHDVVMTASPRLVLAFFLFFWLSLNLPYLTGLL